jgi:hypothetical protein
MLTLRERGNGVGLGSRRGSPCVVFDRWTKGVGRGGEGRE